MRRKTRIRNIIENFYGPTCREILFMGVIAALSVGVAIRKKKWSPLQKTIFPVFVIYLGFIIGITNLFRFPFDNSQYKLELFWSYKRNSKKLLSEILLNYIMLLPYGLIAPLYIKRRWVLISGIWFSIAIEVLQFIFKRGLFEFDDIFGNAIGVAIGIGLYSLLK